MHPPLPPRPALLFVLLVAACPPSPHAPLPSSASQQLWRAYARAPNTNANVPNCSYAGYGASDRSVPTLPIALTVTRDGSDDTSTIQHALDTAAASGGAVFLPAGTYRLHGMLRMTSSNVVLRGAGSDRTVLVFDRSLRDILGSRDYEGSSSYSFFGGLIWITPPDNFRQDGTLAAHYTGHWSGGATLANVAPARRGDSILEVDDPSKLASGRLVMLAWTDDSAHSLWAHVAGDGAMAHFPWNGAHGVMDDGPLRWPVVVAGLDGHRVKLAQPLRLDVRSQWKVAFEEAAPILHDVGVEHLTMRMESGPPNDHLRDAGYNGVYLNRVRDAWVDDVILEDVDNGILTASAKNVTLRNFVVRGARPHHHATYAKLTHDMLVTDFRIESKPLHGINSDLLSSGNVWRRGTIEHGTFDAHRSMSYESIRTDLRIHNDGTEGGDRGNPHYGARVVNWNVVVSGDGHGVAQPAIMPSGALVGVRGVPIDRSSDPDGVMPSDVGCLVVDEGREPSPIDLFQAQLELRLKGQ